MSMKSQKPKASGVIFETATRFKTPRLMEELVHWARKAINEESMHPLLIVAVFTVQFLAIHPFQDGNGRLSRVLTTLKGNAPDWTPWVAFFLRCLKKQKQSGGAVGA